MLARVEAATAISAGHLPRTRRLGDRIGDGLLYGLTALAALLGVLVVLAIVWRVADGAWPAIKLFKLGFLWHTQWNVTLNQFGARELIIGTLVTSFGAMLLSAPLSIAIESGADRSIAPNEVTSVPMMSSRAPNWLSVTFHCVCQRKPSLNSLIAGHAPSATRHTIARTTSTPRSAASAVSP